MVDHRHVELARAEEHGDGFVGARLEQIVRRTCGCAAWNAATAGTTIDGPAEANVARRSSPARRPAITASSSRAAAIRPEHHLGVRGPRGARGRPAQRAHRALDQRGPGVALQGGDLLPDTADWV